jgi:hypothetical protein
MPKYKICNSPLQDGKQAVRDKAARKINCPGRWKKVK